MENLLINGFGSSGGGAYQTVELNGKGTINGDIDCERFSCSGTGTVNGDVKADELRISGHAKLNGAIEASKVRIDGSAKVDGDVEAEKLKAEKRRSAKTAKWNIFLQKAILQSTGC